MPAKAKEKSFAGAKAFTRYYFRVVSYAITTGEVAPMNSLSMKSCKSCSGLTTQLGDVYDSDGRYRTKGWVVREIIDAPGYADNAPVFVAKVLEHSTVQVDSTGKVIEKIAAGNVTMRIFLVRRDSAWRVSEFEAVQ